MPGAALPRPMPMGLKPPESPDARIARRSSIPRMSLGGLLRPAPHLSTTHCRARSATRYAS